MAKGRSNEFEQAFRKLETIVGKLEQEELSLDESLKLFEEGMPPGVPRVAVEAAHPDFWRKYVGLEARAIGISGFGESAPAAALYEHFGLTANAVAEAVAALTATADRALAA